MLGSHGLVTWGDTSQGLLPDHPAHHPAGGRLADGARPARAVRPARWRRRFPRPSGRRWSRELAPVLRGLLSALAPKVDALRRHARRCWSSWAARACRGAGRAGARPAPTTSCARGSRPLFVPFDPGRETVRRPAGPAARPRSSATATDYAAYYERCRRPDSPAMRDPYPVLVLDPRGRACSPSRRTRPTARVAAEYYVNTINVMRWAEGRRRPTCPSPSRRPSTSSTGALEDAKLQRLPRPRSLDGRVALVTGGGGRHRRRPPPGGCSPRAPAWCSPTSIARALGRRSAELRQAARRGPRARLRWATSPTRPRCATSFALRRARVRRPRHPGLERRHRLGVARRRDHPRDVAAQHRHPGHRLLPGRARGLPRDEAPGPRRLDRLRGEQERARGLAGRRAYCTAKAAELHLARCLAARRGAEHGIRVNVVNPDAVIRGSRIWGGTWRAGAGGQQPHRRRRGRGVLPAAQPAEAQRAARGRRGGDLLLRLGAVLQVHRQHPERGRRQPGRLHPLGGRDHGATELTDAARRRREPAGASPELAGGLRPPRPAARAARRGHRAPDRAGHGLPGGRALLGGRHRAARASPASPGPASRATSSRSWRTARRSSQLVRVDARHLAAHPLGPAGERRPSCGPSPTRAGCSSTP